MLSYVIFIRIHVRKIDKIIFLQKMKLFPFPNRLLSPKNCSTYFSLRHVQKGGDFPRIIAIALFSLCIYIIFCSGDGDFPRIIAIALFLLYFIFRDVRVWHKVGQIDSKWNTPGTIYLIYISVQFGSPNQKYCNLILKSPEYDIWCPFCA